MRSVTLMRLRPSRAADLPMCFISSRRWNRRRWNWACLLGTTDDGRAFGLSSGTDVFADHVEVTGPDGLSVVVDGFRTSSSDPARAYADVLDRKNTRLNSSH